MFSYITTHNSQGEAIFSDKIPAEQAWLPMGGDAQWTIINTTHAYPPSVSTEADIDQYAKDRQTGPNKFITTENGTAAGIIEIAPNAESPMHRTMTLDIIVIIEGVVELHLDSGEKKTLKAGDTVTQRATMHKWVNITPNNGRMRMIAIAQPIQEPLEVGGKKLEMEFQSPL